MHLIKIFALQWSSAAHKHTYKCAVYLLKICSLKYALFFLLEYKLYFKQVHKRFTSALPSYVPEMLQLYFIAPQRELCWCMNVRAHVCCYAVHMRLHACSMLFYEQSITMKKKVNASLFYVLTKVHGRKNTFFEVEPLVGGWMLSKTQNCIKTNMPVN